MTTNATNKSRFEHNKRRVARKRLSGLCYQCQKEKPVCGKTRCFKCAEKDKKYYRKHRGL